MCRALLWGSPAMQSCCLWSALQITLVWDLAAYVGSLALWNRAWEKRLALITTWKRERMRTQHTAVSGPGANPRYDGITHNAVLSGRCSTACSGLVKHIIHLSTHTHACAHTLTDTSCQGGFLDWTVLPVGLADWQSRPARPIRSREREPPFFLPFTKKMTHKTKKEQKERAVKCRK